MFLTSKDYNIEDFLQSLGFICPQGYNVAYFITPPGNEIALPQGAPFTVQQLKDMPPDESQVYMQNPPAQKIDQAVTPAEFSVWEPGELGRRQPTPNILPDITDPGEQELGSPFVKMLSESRTYGTDVQLTENFGPFPKNTLFHCVPNKLLEFGGNESNIKCVNCLNGTMFKMVKGLPLCEECYKRRFLMTEGKIGDAFYNNLPSWVRPERTIPGTIGGALFGSGGISNLVDDLGDPRNAGWNSKDKATRDSVNIVRGRPEGYSPAALAAYNKYRDREDAYEAEQAEKSKNKAIARNARWEEGNPTFGDKVARTFNWDEDDAKHMSGNARKNRVKVYDRPGFFGSQQADMSANFDREMLEIERKESGGQMDLFESLEDFELKDIGKNLKKMFTGHGSDKWRVKMFDKIEELSNNNEITPDQAKEYFDRVNARDEELEYELKTLYEAGFFVPEKDKIRAEKKAEKQLASRRKRGGGFVPGDIVKTPLGIGYICGEPDTFFDNFPVQSFDPETGKKGEAGFFKKRQLELIEKRDKKKEW